MNEFDDVDNIFEELGNAEAVFSLAAGGTIGPVKGVFDQSYIDVSVGSIGVESESPVFTCAFDSIKDADGENPIADGDTCLIGRTEYIIRNPKPDGEGSITFDLQEN